MISSRNAATALIISAILAAGCGGADDRSTDQSTGQSQSSTAQNSSDQSESTAAGVRQVSVESGAAIAASPPDDLVILDVRTPEEFDEGHVDGAIMIDFYNDDFADRIADLDPNVPYLLYCRSGSRSSQTAALMARLGFTDVADVDGGILSWSEAGLPLVTP